MVDDEEHYSTSLGLRLSEIVIVLCFAIFYIYIRYNFQEEQPILVAIVGFLLALWAIMRPTEWAVKGLGMLAQRFGIGTYAAGVIGSLMANLPELILAGLLILKGERDIAILTVLVVAGANTLLFGVVTINATRKTGGTVRVPVTTLRYESELMIVAFMTSLFIFVFNFAEEAIQLASNPQSGVPGISRVRIPLLFSVGTVLIYLAYLVFLARDKELNKQLTTDDKIRIKNNPSLSIGNITKFLILGIVGVIVAGELLANGAELLIDTASKSGLNFNEAYIALIVGLLGSLPEWAIAFKAGEDMELVFGTVLSSVSATLLFLIGLVSIFMNIFIPNGFELDPFGLVQIVLSGSILLFVNLLMKDDLRLDAFEGLCIVILQLIGFDILISIK